MNKELNVSVLDLQAVVERCEQARAIISSYVELFLMLVAPSAEVGAPVRVYIPHLSLTPQPLSEFMSSFMPWKYAVLNRDIPDFEKIEELQSIQEALAGYEAYHRELAGISFDLQCAHADHMAKLWKIGYTIKNSSVVPL